jgi:very-short-patch-repair endonuclease
MRIEPKLAELLGRQYGLVALHQLSALGLGRSQWRTLLASGLVEEVDHRVVKLLGSPESVEQRILAGVLGAGCGAVASHGSAAYLWGGLRSLHDEAVDVLTRRNVDGYRKRATCRVHRPADWLDVGTAKRHGIPVTDPVRTLIDLGATAPGLVKFAVERLIIAGVVTRNGLMRGLARHGRQGRRGIGALRGVLQDWSFGETVPDSVLEVRFSDLLVRRGLPEAVFHHEVNGYVLDAAWPEYRVAAEVDGWDKYSVKEQFQHQVRRDALLTALGWRVLHFTWLDVTRKERYVTTALRKTLAAAGYPSDSGLISG